MCNVKPCPSCSRLEKKLNQQNEIIVQLMRIVAASNEKISVIEDHLSVYTRNPSAEILLLPQFQITIRLMVLLWLTTAPVNHFFFSVNINCLSIFGRQCDGFMQVRIVVMVVSLVLSLMLCKCKFNLGVEDI